VYHADKEPRGARRRPRKENIVRFWLLLLLSLMSANALAQAGLRPADETDLIGVWRVMLIDNEVHRSRIRNEDIGYSGICQFFVHRSDGGWHNMALQNAAGKTETLARCPSRKADVEAALTGHQALAGGPYRWSRMNNTLPLYLIQDLGPDGKALAWKADIVQANLPAHPGIGFELLPGDLLMQHARLTATPDGAPALELELVWPMVLRPLRD
jgi:hypothetical protein